jgi:8-oxo-dGTP pyrophosphatase MutT (NUDIX family)
MIEPLETPADAAVRETWEETGLVIALTHVVGVLGGPACTVTYDNGDRMAWVATLFGGHPVGGTLRPDGDETVETRYVGRDEWRALPIRPHLPLFLDAAFAPQASAHFEPATWRPPVSDSSPPTPGDPP